MKSNLAQLFEKLWKASGSPPDVFAFLSTHAGASREERLAIVRVDQTWREKSGAPIPFDQYLEVIAGNVPPRTVRRKQRPPDGTGDRPQGRDASNRSASEVSADLSEAPSTGEPTSAEDLSVSARHRQDATRTYEGGSGDAVWMGRYRLIRVLGEGGFGRVWLGFDEELKRRIAVKVPMPSRFRSQRDADAFLVEARILARLDHPHIVPVHDAGRAADGSIYVVSKFIDGGDLATVLREGRLPVETSARWVAEMARALNHAHERRFIHRDVKPRNILIDRETQQPFVADFGLAISGDDFASEGGIAGTPAYMSPEQARGESHRLDGRSDLFSLGAVFYEMLTGQRAFGDTRRAETLRQVITVDPPSPREIDPSIPAEVERICMKALAKRATDRYATGLELADDLLHWLAGPDSPSYREIPILPKSLRSFDEGDADFFLDLLPGPRDRDGLPDSIRFWKTRLEETDAEKTFAVGMLYGPSGCGKSSMVKAGLLPRLSDSVVTVYVEATADETEGRILHRLQRQVPRLAPGLSLFESIAALRRGVGKKVVIIVDQFEQWLHGRAPDPNSELVTALRQCDGGNVQCIVMVRDDFAMAACRFMRDLETRIVEGQNFATVDLFDVDHALHVLAKFGRAFGRLPAISKALSEEQKEFVAAAASGLAREGKVVSVRLALFAEMIKGRPWVPATLAEVGGTTGIGISFLEESFAGREANPEHHAHQAAARAVLRALLPEAGTDIKGNMRSHVDLFHASGCADRGEFADVLRILDGELRLITPTDPEGSDSESARDPDARYYQLTHDYLVPSLREWLTRKQKETWRGRAELRLAEYAASWTANPKRQRLPTWFEYLGMRALTRRRSWSPPELRMMRAAARYHGLRFAVAFSAFLVAGAAVRGYIAEQDRVLAKQKRDAGQDLARSVVDAVLAAPADAVPYAIRNLEPLREYALPILRRELVRPATDSLGRLRAAMSLAAFGDLRLDNLLASVGNAPANECANVVTALGHDREAALRSLRVLAGRLNDRGKTPLKARLAVLLLQLGDTSVARQMFALDEDPIDRTVLIEGLATWHGAVNRLVENVADSEPGPLRSGICLGIGSISAKEIPAGELDALASRLLGWYQNDPDAGIHSASGWALRQWNQALPSITAPADRPADHRWRVNSVGMTMVWIPAGTPIAFAPRDDAPAPGRVEAFWFSNCETSRALFQQFIDDPATPASSKPGNWKGAFVERSPTVLHPVQNVTWEDAVLYCNWLSHREGRAACYTQSAKGWVLNKAADGYRLPTEVEWEYACRAGARTLYAIGDDDSLLDRYAVFASNHTETCGSRMPNGWGLFDVHGNVYEWCQDWFPPPKTDHRVLRGGAYDFAAIESSASRRSPARPNYRSYTIGFRVARSNR